MTQEEKEQFDKDMAAQGKILAHLDKQRAIDEGRYAFTLAELMDLDFDSATCLLDPILPSNVLVGIVGKPDSGKSMFARELSLRVAMGFNEFMGLQLNPKHQRALYIVTEDGLRSTRDVLMKQYYSLVAEMYQARKEAENDGQALPTYNYSESKFNIEVLPASELSSKELLDLLKEKFDEAAYDIVVIDAIADVLSAKDGNSNFQIRDGLKPYATFAEKQQCLVVFIGHINKSAYKTSPDQADVQGAAAFAQKARVILDLRADTNEPNARYLAVTKGNAVASEHKRTARKLVWDPDTFLTRYCGEVISVDRVGSAGGPEKTFIDWPKYLQPGETLRFPQLWERARVDIKMTNRAFRDRAKAELMCLPDHLFALPDHQESLGFDPGDVTPMMHQ